MTLSIRFRYLLAVFLLAILVTSSWFWLSKIINQQSQDAQVINRAGQQRMLSQRIALLSYRIDKAGEIDAVNKQLEDAVTTFASNHTKLTNLEHIPDGAKSLYFGDVQLIQSLGFSIINENSVGIIIELIICYKGESL